MVRRVIYLQEIQNSIDAGLAGSENFQNCTLYIYGSDQDIRLPNDHVGTIVISKETWVDIEYLFFMDLFEHRDILNLKRILGLRRGVDYQNPAGYNTLRYGHIQICTDSFTSGNILWFLQNHYPTLMQYVSVFEKIDHASYHSITP